MLQHLKNATNVAYTENGGRANATTQSAVLDYFAQGSALRNRSENEIISLFSKALGEDALLTLKILFYSRDLRGGQGERDTFRKIIRYLANVHTDLMAKNLHLIPLFGRWDDVYALFGTKLQNRVGQLIANQFKEDMVTEYPSLLGKWLKSENTSSPESRKLATQTRKMLGLTERQYRKSLVALRNKINILETLMSKKKWHEIDYSKIPSQAGMKHRKAFFRNDELRYEHFLESLKNGETKINAKTLFPYEIARNVGHWGGSREDDVINAMWENQPDYIGENKKNMLVVADVSGSMNGTPMDVSVSLAIYTAERNRGQFHNHFMTFSSQPQLVELQGRTFCERVRNVKRAQWAMNTDIKAVFDLILSTAIRNNVPQSEMVEIVTIVSDMEFDRCSNNRSQTVFQTIREKYENAGYKLPKLVFWNVNARSTQFPMTMNDEGVQLVSGCSPSIFTNLMKDKFMNAYDLMLDVLNNERYNFVTI